MRLKKHKLGQGAVEVSVFVILLALFIIIYVILLPPGERSELLNESLETTGGAVVPAGAEVLLSESPGKVYSYSKNLQTSRLEPLHLYSKDDTETTNLVKSLTVSRNLLKDNYRNVIFSLDNKKNIKELKLFMLVTENDGRMTVKLNDHIVFQGLISGSQLLVELPLDYLKENNKLEFSVSLPGFSEFYTTNHYYLEDISLIKVYSTTNTEADRLFFIDMEEGQKVRKTELKYLVNCNELEPRGRLTIKMNNNLQSRDVVFCEYSDEIVLPLNKDDLSADGRNKLSFSIDAGDYNLDQVRVVSELGKSIYPKYVFDIDSDDHSELNSGTKKLMLRMAFGESDRKKATVFIQESRFSLDTSSDEYVKDITSMVDNGANFIKIVPQENFEIPSLKISLEDA